MMPQLDESLLEEAVAAQLADGAGRGTTDADPHARRQAAVVTIGRRAIAPPDPKMLVHDATELIAETLDADGYGMAELAADGGSLSFRFATRGKGIPDTGVVTHQLPAAKQASLAGYALHVAHPVVVTDLGRESRFCDIFLRQHKVVSAVACPLVVQTHAFGSICVCTTHPHEFTKEDVLFVETIAHLITTTMARHRAETELAKSSQFTTAVLDTVDSVVMVVAPDGRIMHVNRACQRVTGFAPRDVKGRHLWSTLLIPEEVPLVKNGFDRLIAGESPVEFESFVLTKVGDRRRISWAYTLQRRPDGSIDSLIGTGRDVTQQRITEAQLKKTAAEVRKSNKAYDELKAKTGGPDAGLIHAPDDADFDENSVRPFSVLPAGIYADRRERVRRAYPYLQRIAPIINGVLPRQDQFFDARCRDISAAGFSFLCPQQPRHKQLIVALGVPPALTYLSAEIVHSTTIQRDGRMMYMVGCQYTGRVHSLARP